MTATKNDFIVGAYELMRISGITVLPSPEDNLLALKQLENLMAELQGRNICLNYNFEDDPLTTSVHNVDRKYWFAIQILLADRLLPAFGKAATAEFIRVRSAAQSSLSSSCAIVKSIPYPNRMPRGMGASQSGLASGAFFPESASVPIECSTHTMYIGDIDDFVEHYTSFLKAGETISSYTLTADTGLTIVSESLASPDVNYQVSAVGNNENTTEVLQIKIVVTTSSGRVKTRIIDFELIPAD